MADTNAETVTNTDTDTGTDTDTIATFERSLRDLEVDCRRVTPSTFDDALEDALVEPAVGARLPFDHEGVSLPESVTLDPTPAELDRALTGVTAAALGIAEYGTLVLRSTPDGSEPVSLFPDYHVAIVAAEDVVLDMDEAFDRMAETIAADRGSAILATGPSATADMGSLVTGAHGPKHVRVLVLEEDESETESRSEDGGER